ncbi:hypothetical protein Tco_1188142, partial [Tanacetum coccineum]
TESCSTSKQNEQQSRYPEKQTKLMHSNDEIRSFNPKRKATIEKIPWSNERPLENKELNAIIGACHNVDIDDGWTTMRHVFYQIISPITWCSQKQTTVALSSCEAEFMAAIAAACQAIWLREVLTEVMENEQVIVEHVSGENKE